MNAPMPAATASPGISNRRAIYTLILLTMVWTLNFVDRNVFAVVLEPIKQEYHFSDTVLGVVAGFGFTLLYSLASLPLARIADNSNRVTVISAGLTVWSLLTFVTGFVTSAGQLVTARVLMGIGEASSSAPSQSLLAEYFPPARRGRVMSTLSTATFFGVMLAYMVGSYCSAHFGWRSAFLVVGIPGLILALLVKLTVPELRTRAGHKEAGGERIPLGETIRFLCGQLSFVYATVSFWFAFFVNAAIITWVSPLLFRAHHMSLETIGFVVGPILGGAGIAGSAFGAVIISSLSARDMRWLLWVPAICLFVSAPALLLFCLSPTAGAALVGLGIATFCGSLQIGPMVAAILSVARPRTRALAGSLNLVTASLVGYGSGPLIVGALSDWLHAQMGDQSLRFAFLCTVAITLIGGVIMLHAATHLKRDLVRVG